jgi:thioredoxin-like negative regulator of GroEL
MENFKDSTAKLKDIISGAGKENTPVIVGFFVEWCGHCQAFKPSFEQAINRYGKKVQFFAVDCEKNAAVAEAFGIEGYPTIKLFEKGEEKDLPRMPEEFLKFCERFEK